MPSFVALGGGWIEAFWHAIGMNGAGAHSNNSMISKATGDLHQLNVDLSSSGFYLEQEPFSESTSNCGLKIVTSR